MAIVIPAPNDLLGIVGNIMLLVGVAGLLMQIGRWLQKRNVPAERAHFFVIVAVVVVMGATTIILNTIQSDSIHELEREILANQKLTHQGINATLANQIVEQQILKELHFHILTQSHTNQTQSTLIQELQKLIQQYKHPSLGNATRLLPPSHSPLKLNLSQLTHQTTWSTTG
jgi:predicted PurR-regulated permease PerM